MATAPPPRTGKPTQGLDRLRRRQDFVAVLQDGKRVRHRLVHVGVRPNGLAVTRVGYAIGKRIGTAVVRNRTRRRLREIIRALPLVPGFDVVVTGQPPAATATYAELHDSLEGSARRGGILTNTGQIS